MAFLVRTPALMKKGLRLVDVESDLVGAEHVRTPALMKKGLRRLPDAGVDVARAVRTPALMKKGLRPTRTRRSCSTPEGPNARPDEEGIKT